ncbi:hypothetical protein [Cohnella sp.]|uniref:hypothetical protein n=1 Tax=Cohnella sp. TaxID=1883426 RepID=UPI00356774D7
MFNPYDYYITPEEYEMAERNRISRSQLNDRIRKHAWNKKRAITTPIRNTTRTSPEIRTLAKANGIRCDLLLARLNLGWNEIIAATKPVRDIEWKRENARLVGKRNRKYSLEVLELAAKNAISYGTFTKRVTKSKWDIFRTASVPVSPYNCIMRLKEIYGESYLRDLQERCFQSRRTRGH